MNLLLRIPQMLSALLQTSDFAHEEDFNLFLFSFVVVGLAAMVVSLVLVILFAVVVLLFIFGMVAMGSLSASLIVGLNKRSYTAGFRTFVILFTGASGALIGGGILWVFNRIVHYWSQSIAVCIGLFCGLLGGLAIGFVLAYLIRKITAWIKQKKFGVPIVRQ